MPVVTAPPKRASSKFVQTSAKYVPYEEPAPQPRRDAPSEPREDRELGVRGARHRPDSLERSVEVRRYVLREISTQTDNRPSDRQIQDRPEARAHPRGSRPSRIGPRADSSVEDANESLEKSPPMRPKGSSIESTPDGNKRRASQKQRDPAEPAAAPKQLKPRKSSAGSKQARQPLEEDPRPDRQKRSASTKRESHRPETRTRPNDEYDTGEFKIKAEKLPKHEKLEGSREASKANKKSFDPKPPNQNFRDLISAQRSHSRKQADVIRALEEEKESLKLLISKMILENRKSHQKPTREQKSPEPRYMSPIGHKHKHPNEEREADPKNKPQPRSPPRFQNAARSPESTGHQKRPQTATEKTSAPQQTTKPPRTKSKHRDSEDLGFASPQKNRGSADAGEKPPNKRTTGFANGPSSPTRSPTRKSPFDVQDSKTEWDRTGHLINRFDRVSSEGHSGPRYASLERSSPRPERYAASPPRPGSPEADDFGFRHRHGQVREKCSDIVFEGTLYHLRR